MKVSRKGGRGWSFDVSSTKPFARGGEADVYDIPGSQGLVAKIYKNPTGARVRKLEAMLANPPDTSSGVAGRPAIAWPIDLMQEVSNGAVVGYLMPKVTGTQEVFKLYIPRSRMKLCPAFNYKYLVHTARNVASVAHSIHDKGYVIGDINERNILVSSDAVVTVIDTDSFQVLDLSGRLHRCPVGTPEFTPAELQGKDLTRVDRNVDHDGFGVGIILFKLLMEGLHPFDGHFLMPGTPPLHAERIGAGLYPHSSRQTALAPLAFPPLSIVGEELERLFLRCFEAGHENPTVRPSAREWHAALKRAELDLTQCANQGNHIHHRSLKSCPWCTHYQKTGVDLFPGKTAHKTAIAQTGLTPAGFKKFTSTGAATTRTVRTPRGGHVPFPASLKPGPAPRFANPAAATSSPRPAWPPMWTILASGVSAALFPGFRLGTGVLLLLLAVILWFLGLDSKERRARANVAGLTGGGLVTWSLVALLLGSLRGYSVPISVPTRPFHSVANNRQEAKNIQDRLDAALAELGPKKPFLIQFSQPDSYLVHIRHQPREQLIEQATKWLKRKRFIEASSQLTFIDDLDTITKTGTVPSPFGSHQGSGRGGSSKQRADGKHGGSGTQKKPTVKAPPPVAKEGSALRSGTSLGGG